MAETTPTKRKYAAPALEKGFDILEMLAREKVPMSLAQMSEKLSRSKSEIFRMVTTLEQRGYLSKKPGSDYFYISNKLFDLGMSVPPTGTLVEAAYPLMHELSHATQSSCHMAVASGERMVVIARVESPSSVGLSVRIGHHLDLYESGSGLVLLSFMDEQQKLALFERYKNTRADFDRALVETQIERITANGYAKSESQIIQGVVDLSFPIMLNEQVVLASLTVPYLKGRFSHADITETFETLRDTAQRISTLASSYGGF
ncbi:IclR family transcriptional regulator [Gayadomonas joobiniege]|uniref:IclR family transcriptional regulator n=1 Tax=Gayadomonas joobiniege TaxID=1234606 RepID=UPI000375EFBB|nr:IclR family transcriptional regulator [Gayadomonas joobiniege]